MGVSSLLDAYYSWSKQARRAIERNIGLSIEPPEKTPLVVCGMGGSGIVGDYLQALTEVYGGAPVYVVKSYKPPSWLSSSHLAVIVSYSGNTIETLGCYKKALEKEARRLVVTSGGRLLDYAKKQGDPISIVEKGPAARAVFASLLYSTLAPLVSSGLVDLEPDLLEKSVEVLENTKTAEREAEKIASHLHSRRAIPVFVACCEYQALALRLKNEFNENAKTPAKIETLPELGHNDIEEWNHTLAGEILAPILLDPQTPIYSDLLETYEKTASIKALRLELIGENTLEKLLWGSLVGGIASIKLAQKNNIDPLTIAIIKEYRRNAERILGF